MYFIMTFHTRKLFLKFYLTDKIQNTNIEKNSFCFSEGGSELDLNSYGMLMTKPNHKHQWATNRA